MSSSWASERANTTPRTEHKLKQKNLNMIRFKRSNIHMSTQTHTTTAKKALTTGQTLCIDRYFCSKVSHEKWKKAEKLIASRTRTEENPKKRKKYLALAPFLSWLVFKYTHKTLSLRFRWWFPSSPPLPFYSFICVCYLFDCHTQSHAHISLLLFLCSFFIIHRRFYYNLFCIWFDVVFLCAVFRLAHCFHVTCIKSCRQHFLWLPYFCIWP